MDLNNKGVQGTKEHLTNIKDSFGSRNYKATARIIAYQLTAGHHSEQNPPNALK